MDSRSKLEFVAWATARENPREHFWHSRLGEPHSHGRNTRFLHCSRVQQPDIQSK